MSRLSLFRRGLLSTGGGGGSSPLAIVFDTRWGTSTDANGWITFALPVGRRRVWCDSSRPDDTGDGLSAATAKKTFNAAFNVFIDASWGAGDILMLAGGSAGGLYTDTTASSLTFFGGTGPSLMTVVQSYDRADPTGATTTFGRLLGSPMPVLQFVDGSSSALTVVNVDGKGYVAVQGIELKDISSPRLAASSSGISMATNNHPGLVYQNVRFNGVGFSSSPSTGTVTAATNTPNAGLISKCSQWNSNGIFIESSDSFRVEEFISVHNGWDITAIREDPVMSGGTTVFAHPFYMHASNTNLALHRIVCVDGVDGLGARCGSVSANQLVSIDNPVGLNSGGASSNPVTERPDGAPYALDDAVIMGSDKWIAPTANPGGWAMEWENNNSGSVARNVAAFDFDAIGFDAGFNRLFAGTRVSASQVPSFMLIDKWSTWQFAVTAESDSGTDLTNYHFSVSNSVLDVMPTGLNGSVTNTTTRSTAPAGYKTRAQTYAAMGYATKSDLVNAMLFRPDLSWAQAICGISLPAMGLTPTYQTTSPPVVTGAPVIYPTALVDLTASTTTFIRGTPKILLLTGVAPCSTLACADLPAGFSTTAFRLQTTGTATLGSNVIAGVADTTGVTPGMYVEAKSSAYTFTSLFPANTIVTAVTANSITCSSNATASSNGTSPEAIFVSAGGRTIRYDGSGTGAATPTIHIVETAKDTAMGTHTTPFTLSIS